MSETLDQNRWLSPNQTARSQVPLYTLAGPTYLVAHLIAPIAPKALKNEPIGLRLYDTGNRDILSRAIRDQFNGFCATENEVIQFPFALATQLNADGFRPAEDNCPIPEKQRLRVLEARTREIEIKSVENTDQLIFLPHIQVADLIGQNRLQAIEVSEWAPVRKTAYLTVHQDKVKQKYVNILLQALEAGLTRCS